MTPRIKFEFFCRLKVYLVAASLDESTKQHFKKIERSTDRDIVAIKCHALNNFISFQCCQPTLKVHKRAWLFLHQHKLLLMTSGKSSHKTRWWMTITTCYELQNFRRLCRQNEVNNRRKNIHQSYTIFFLLWCSSFGQNWCWFCHDKWFHRLATVRQKISALK